MKKIFIDAYTKMNLGDDMFLISLVRRYPNVRFVTSAEGKYTLSYSGEKKLSVVKRRKKNRVLRQLEYMIKYDGYIKLGGSIFMEKPGGKKLSPIPRLISKIFNRNKFVIGANFGPYYSDNFLKRAKASFYGYRRIHSSHYCTSDVKHFWNVFQQSSTCPFTRHFLNRTPKVYIDKIGLCLLHDTCRICHALRITTINLYCHRAFVVANLQFACSRCNITHQSICIHKFSINTRRTKSLTK